VADATGPISTLPGARYAVPERTPCDDCGAPATVRLQGETDSFGCEMHDLCADCARKEQQSRHEFFAVGKCDWCQKDATDRREQRDYDEGTSGRVYQVCGACRENYRRELEREELEHYEADPIDDWEDDDDAEVCA